MKGSFVDHPGIRAVAANASATSRVTMHDVGSLVVALYASKRLTFKRTAIDALPFGGVLVVRVHSESAAYQVAISKEEFIASFPNVIASRSWQTRGIYDYNSVPAAVHPFLLEGGALPGSRLRANALSGVDETLVSPERVAAVVAWLHAVSERFGLPTQSDTYVSAVLSWQERWRPGTVKRLLVLPYPRPEEDGDASIAVSMPILEDAVFPTSFARSVHCFGFGENDLCAPVPWANHGALHIWDFIATASRGSYDVQPRFAQSTLESRIAWKRSLVDELRAGGTFVVYAGVAATLGPEFAGSHSGELMLQSWRTVVWPELAEQPISSITCFSEVAREVLICAGKAALLTSP